MLKKSISNKTYNLESKLKHIFLKSTDLTETVKNQKLYFERNFIDKCPCSGYF